jgi:hypothetical protein
MHRTTALPPPPPSAHTSPAPHTRRRRVCHAAAPQDYPIMPVEAVGFMLKPYGFFTWNPTLVRCCCALLLQCAGRTQLCIRLRRGSATRR